MTLMQSMQCGTIYHLFPAETVEYYEELVPVVIHKNSKLVRILEVCHMHRILGHNRVNDHFSDTSIFRQSYYRVEKCTESRFFTEMIRPFYGTCSQKMKLLRPMTRTCKPKMHNRLKSVVFGEISI